MASMEWPEGNFMEGLMQDADGNVIEGTRSNIFWAKGKHLFTPDLSGSGVEGIMRNRLLKTISGAAINSDSTLDHLVAADEVFICNSVFGIWPVTEIYDAGKAYKINTGNDDSFTSKAATIFNELLAS